MEKTKTAKNKFLIAIAIMCIAFISVTGALIGVLAASSQTLSSTFNIAYEIGDNIAFKVSAWQQFPNEDVVSLGSVQYNVNDTTEGTLTAGNATLTAETKVVKFIYLIENLTDKTIHFIPQWNDLQSYWNDGENFVDNDAIKNIGLSFSGWGDYCNPTTGTKTVEVFYNQESMKDISVFEANSKSIMFPNVGVSSNFAFTIEKGKTQLIDFTINILDINRSAYCISIDSDGVVFTVSNINPYA